MKDKSGKEITFKEFMDRWKVGMMNITPYQQAVTIHRAYFVVLVGIILGIIVSVINKTWWLVTILAGSFVIQLVSTLANWQKIQVLKLFEVKNTKMVLENQPTPSYV